MFFQGRALQRVSSPVTSASRYFEDTNHELTDTNSGIILESSTIITKDGRRSDMRIEKGGHRSDAHIETGAKRDDSYFQDLYWKSVKAISSINRRHSFPISDTHTHATTYTSTNQPDVETCSTCSTCYPKCWQNSANTVHGETVNWYSSVANHTTIRSPNIDCADRAAGPSQTINRIQSEANRSEHWYSVDSAGSPHRRYDVTMRLFQDYLNVQYSIHQKERWRRPRTVFSEEQIESLEKEYSKCKYLRGNERKKLCTKLSLEERHVKVWYQNRRAKERNQLKHERWLQLNKVKKMNQEVHL